MELYIDLKKAGVNKGKLVLKKVAVRQPSGKITYANRWVDPTSDTPIGKDKAPKIADTKRAKSPRSVTRFNSQEPELVVPYTEKTSKSPGKQPKVDTSSDSWVTENIRNDITNIINTVTANLDEMENYSSLLGYLSPHIYDKYKTEIQDQQRKSIRSDPSTSDFQKDIQERTLQISMTNPDSSFSVIGSDPDILDACLSEILGEGVYRKALASLSNSTLSINTKTENLEGIKKSGTYVASTPKSYLLGLADDLNRETISIQFDEFIERVEEADYFEDVIFELEHLGGDEDIDPVIVNNVNVLKKRAEAEYNSIGLEFHEPKPVYIAYNAFNDEEGGSTFYGNSWLDVDDSILPQCTINIGDTFYESSPISKIGGMDHLHKLAVLKALLYNPDLSTEEFRDSILNDSIHDKDNLESGWMMALEYGEDVPLELHYHNPELKADKVKAYHK